MPCNGFGHAPDCECGWGGEFHEKEDLQYSPQYWQNLENHTKPNSKCHRCGASVFFYRSPDGGSVFFDELGWPWPKHECLYGENAPPSGSNSSSIHRYPTWPFAWKEKWPLPNKEGTLLIDVENRMLFVRARWEKIPLCTPIWLSRHSTIAGRYRASHPSIKDGRVYESAYDAYTTKSLRSLEHAIFFQATIQNINAANK